MEKLKTKDKDFYLQSGNLTSPFLPDDFVLSKVMTDYNEKQKSNKDYTKLQSLYNWIKFNVKYGDEKFNENFRFSRSAEEIWESKITTGCTDYAMLFATFARQIGIPTTILHTAELKFVENLQNNEKRIHHAGHSFCECFYDGKWILVDPTFRKIEYKYDPEKIELSYKVGDGSTFIPYYRGLDLEKRQNTKEHNKFMDDLCRNIKIEKSKEKLVYDRK